MIGPSPLAVSKRTKPQTGAELDWRARVQEPGPSLTLLSRIWEGFAASLPKCSKQNAARFGASIVVCLEPGD